MARNERQDNGTHGGIGTMARPAAGARPRPAAPPEETPPGQRRGRQASTEIPAQRAEAGQQAVRARQAATGQRPVPGQRAVPGQRPVPGQRAVPGQRPVPGQRSGPGQRPARNQRPATDRVTADQVAAGAARPGPVPRARPAVAPGVPGTHRMPFVLLLCGLLGGALVSALVISTTLAEGAFEITNLQHSTNALARQRQALEEQVAQARSAQVIAARAARLGMRPAGMLRFIDLTTGKTSTDAATGWQSQISVPGYTP